jgi:hypothetical protein
MRVLLTDGRRHVMYLPAALLLLLAAGCMRPPPPRAPLRAQPSATDGGKRKCSLRAAIDHVTIPAYSTEGLSVDAHIYTSSCVDGRYTLLYGGCKGTIKQMYGRGVRYYPPSREADRTYAVKEDEIPLTIECKHDGELETKLPIEITPPSGGSRKP